MGNACCSDGGHIIDKEFKNYSSKPKNHDQYAPNDEVLLAYTSGDQKKIVKIQSNFRGHTTRKKIEDDGQII